MSTRRFGRYTVETSNEDKVLFPEIALSKRDLIDYYDRVAESMLPWLRARPLVLQRFPDGISEPGFYQKQVAEHFPDWIRTVTVDKADGGSQDLVVCENRATLVQLAQLGCVTLHPWLSRRDKLAHPDQLVIDLDPADDDFEVVRRAARAVRDLCEELELPTWLKTSGSRGVHVVVPLDRSTHFDEVREFARDAMALLARRRPQELTLETRVSKRRGRLYLDVGRNAYAQTAVAPYSVRALPGAPVATPIDWSELGDIGPRDFHVRNLFRRLARRKDPWRAMRRHARSLGAARRRLERLTRAQSGAP